MLPEQVDEMLRSYKQCAGRCEHLALQIKITEREIQSIRSTMVGDASVLVQQYETMDMPRGSGVANPVQNLALKFAAGYVPEDLKEIEASLVTLKKEYGQRLITVQFVETWLRALNEKERWLITEQMIEGRYWREITAGWKVKFGETIGKEALKKAKARAKEKIYLLAG